MPKIRPLEFLPAPERPDLPAVGVDVWRCDLDHPHWPAADRLPETERLRAERLLREEPRRRWVASRWFLRAVLGRYLDCPPAAVELELGEHGKPRLAAAGELAFNLSHSANLALLAVADREVGVDVERINVDRHPPAFYDEWTANEARVKCLGIGLTGVPSGATPAIEVHRLELGGEFAAAVAIADAAGAVRGWTFDPDRTVWP